MGERRDIQLRMGLVTVTVGREKNPIRVEANIWKIGNTFM